MAEVGTVIAVIQIADRLIELTRYWIEGVRDAPSDLRSILLETSLLRTTFETIKFLSNCNETSSATLSSLSQPDGPLHHCSRVLEDLLSLLPAEHVYTTSRSRSKKERALATLSRLAWPLKQPKARKLLQELERFKTDIGLALTTDSLNGITDIKAKATEALHMLTESQRFTFCEWFEQTNPSSLHNRAKQQLEEGTCHWILRLPEWSEWLAAKHRCLWIHGIPGAGKTILASYMVEQVRHHCTNMNASRRAVVYYYCYFGHYQDESAPLMRWTVTQLCRQARSVPAYAYSLFEQGREPGLPELLNALAACLDLFETAYLVIDALDESKPRDNLLKALRDLVTDPRFGKLQLLVTSREYIDIERVLETISTPVSMSNPSVAEDIKCYVRATLQSNPKFSRWPQSLLSEVETELPNRARGMFRWAVCQVDRLRRLKCEPRIIRNALASLPKTLDETYERIFSEIPEEERSVVRQCLSWINFHNEQFCDGIPCAILLQGLETLFEAPSDVETTYSYFDEESIRDTCGCLVQISTGDGFTLPHEGVVRQGLIVSLAHYTVREFLTSDRLSASTAAYFGLGFTKQSDTLRSIFRTALNFRASDFSRENPGEDSILESCTRYLHPYCVLSAVLAISNSADQIACEPELADYAFELLDPSAQHFGTIMDFLKLCEYTLNVFTSHNSSFRFETLQWTMEPTTIQQHAMVLLEILALSPNSYQLAMRFLQKTDKTMDLVHVPLRFEVVVDTGYRTFCRFDGPMIEFFAQLPQQADYFRFRHILDEGSSPSDPTPLLYSYLSSHRHFLEDDVARGCLLNRILALGADFDGHGYTTTPLQIAVDRSDFDGVKVLLEAGADPNRIGDLAGTRWRSIQHIWRRSSGQELNYATEATDERDDYRDLNGLSPLFICRNKSNSNDDLVVVHHSQGELDALLRQFGAEYFSQNDDY